MHKARVKIKLDSTLGPGTYDCVGFSIQAESNGDIVLTYTVLPTPELTLTPPDSEKPKRTIRVTGAQIRKWR